MKWPPLTLAYALFRSAEDAAEAYGDVIEPPAGFEPEHSHRSALAGRRPERLGMGRVARHPQRIGTKG